MVHGPCGRAKPTAPCTDKGECTKHYPKNYNCQSTLDEEGFPIYQRRNNGRKIIKNGVQFDNRDIVPHNVGLIVRYQAHINVEWCNKSRSIKYLFKYINKGPDRGTFLIEQTRDEIKEYLNCRYVSVCEAVWRIFQFDINYRCPSVQRLSFHLPGKQPVTYRDHQQVETVLSRDDIERTMFTEWLKANEEYEDEGAKELTYTEFPEKFVWHVDAKEWRPRKKVKSIGRVVYAHPTSGEHVFLRMLLNIVRGPTSYEEIRHYNGITYPTFKAACYTRRLLDGDKEWHDAIQEASRWATAAQLRQLFVTMLLFCEVSDPLELWNGNWKHLSDDVLHRQRTILRYPELCMSYDQLKNYALFEIEKLLLKSRRSLKDFPPMPLPDRTLLQSINNTLIRDELRINREEVLHEHNRLHAGLNTEQKIIYEKVIAATSTDRGGLFFIYGHRGTGKTYLYKTIISKLRSQGELVLAVASSGIAALLLPLGRTAHSRLDIPMKLTDTSTCNIAQGTPLAELLKKTKLIVWDEAPMTHRYEN
ncbi:uncharacterized protein LOC141648643 [Silene latifolia]|uniref:uncharacterized protein LOC141648643 n=1 Tax=Silene latifolia TaxID=37657 RepID=UPI003D76E34A